MLASHSGRFVHRTRSSPQKAQIFTGASNEKRTRCSDAIESLKVGVAFVKKVNGYSFKAKVVQPIAIVQAGRRYKPANRNRSAQIKLGVNLDRALGRTECRQWKQRHRLIDHARVQGGKLGSTTPTPRPHKDAGLC